MDDNIIQLDHVRVERKIKRKCVCEVRNYIVDKVNREVKCGCGVIHDPFEAMLDFAENAERINEQHKRMKEQRDEWQKEKPWSVIFKRLEQQYRRGTMLPGCPKCEQLFDFKDISWWGNAEFYRKLETKKAENIQLR